MILGADNRKPWSDLDVLVMQAYQIIEDERCGQCGMPRWLCHNADQRLMVRVKTDRCMARVEMDEFEEKRQEGKKKGEDEEGAAYPEFYLRPDAEGMDLVEFRALYYEQLRAEQADDEQD